MGLLDSVIGALGQRQGGGGGGLGGGLGGGGQAALIAAVIGMLMQGGGAGGAAGGGLGGSGGLGGLGGLLEKFTRNGMGDMANSWVSTGPNQPVSPDQLGQALGNDTLAGLAQQLGMGQDELGTQLSQLLPEVVDRITPDGQVPADGGAGGLNDLAGLLGGLLRR